VPERPPRPGRPASLFDFATPQEEAAAPAPAAQSWLEQLLRSEVYKVQKDIVRKHLPEAALVRCLEVLQRQGGSVTLPALAQQAGILPSRLDGHLTRLQRLLNVDGYEVLLVDRVQNRATVNVDLLRQQFELV
jgi:hypothetical protein